MPIVTINELQGTSTQRTAPKNDPSNTIKRDSLNCTENTQTPTTSNDIINSKKINVEKVIQKIGYDKQSAEMKKRDEETEQLPLLIPKKEIDADSIDSTVKQELTTDLNIKEELRDSDEDCKVSSSNNASLLASVAKVIQLACKKEREGTFIESSSNQSDEEELKVNSVNTAKSGNADSGVVKRKRGRPRKNPDDDFNPKAKKPKLKRPKKTGGKAKARAGLDEAELPKFTCPICKGDEKRTEKQLRLHYKDDHGGRRLRTSMLSTETVPCDVCGKTFRSSYHLKEHMETHNNYFNCEICDTSHRRAADHAIHMRIHTDKGFFKCLYCDYISEQIPVITEHINNCDDQVPHYTCDICKKGFNLLSWYREHSNFHSGLKPFACDLCDKSFMYSRYLSAHKNFMHKDELGGTNVHECVICHKQYQHRNSLKLHMNSHTGNFAICDVCGKILSSREKLKFHMRTHTGYKPFDCQYCGKCFTKKPILVEHIRIHTGERPYVCEFCNKAFSQRSSLVIHIRSHTVYR